MLLTVTREARTLSTTLRGHDVDMLACRNAAISFEEVPSHEPADSSYEQYPM
jgi:hypothetical protein